MKNLLEKIQKQFDISDVDIKRENLAYITVDESRALPLLEQMKESEGMTHMVLMSAVDWIEDGKFQLTYTLYNPEGKFDIGVRVFIDREKATMDSAHRLWKSIATYQRELFEMFAIDFPGSPGLKDPLVLEGWDGPPPYRRDFDTLEYSEKTFFPREGRSTNDPKTHMKKETYGEWKKGEDDVK